MFEEEEEPESLKKKWEKEDLEKLEDQKCSACGQSVPGDAFFCLFCGERVFEKSGLLGRLAFWTKHGHFVWIVLLLLFACSFFFLF